MNAAAGKRCSRVRPDVEIATDGNCRGGHRYRFVSGNSERQAKRQTAETIRPRNCHGETAQRALPLTVGSWMVTSFLIPVELSVRPPWIVLVAIERPRVYRFNVRLPGSKMRPLLMESEPSNPVRDRVRRKNSARHRQSAC